VIYPKNSKNTTILTLRINTTCKGFCGNGRGIQQRKILGCFLDNDPLKKRPAYCPATKRIQNHLQDRWLYPLFSWLRDSLGKCRPGKERLDEATH